MVNHYLTPGAIVDSSHTWDETQTFADSTALAFGTGADSKIYFDGSDTYWDLQATGTGGLMIALADSPPAPDNDMVHIWAGTAGSTTAPSNSLLVLEDNSNDVGLTFLTGNSGGARIQWGDVADNDAGRIEYDHATNRFQFAIDGTTRLKYTAATFAFQEATTISTSTGALTLDPTAGLALSLVADTAQAQTTTDGSATYHEIDTRTGTVGVYAHKFDCANPTLASASNATFQLVEFSANTLTLTGTTTVTSKQSQINISAMTITDTSAVEVEIASTLRIEGPPNTGGSVTIANGYALYVDAGAARFDGAISLAADHGDDGQQLTSGGDNAACDWTAASSLREHKDIGSEADSGEALQAMLDSKAYHFRYKTKKGTGDSKTEYVGLMADDAPWAMHYKGTIVNPVNTLGYTVLAVQALNEKIERLEALLAS